MEIKVFNKLNIAPYKAEYIGVFDSENKLVKKIKLNKLKQDYGERLYRVGLMSDVHYNDTDPNMPGVQDGNQENAYEDITNTLSFFSDKTIEFFNNKESIEFCCVAGDITTNERSHYLSWKKRCDELAPNTAIYTCKGNHDNAASYADPFGWKNSTIPTNGLYPITEFSSDSLGSSYYFIKEEPENGIKDVYIFFNVSYNNNKANASIKLSDRTSYRYYSEDAIVELQTLLDEHRNDRCFIFTHQFFPNKAGTPSNDYTREGNSHSHDYWLCGRQFVLLNEMNNYYKNSVWFSGHSHYQWKWQYTDETNGNGVYRCERANVCNWDGLPDDYKYNDYDTWARTDTDEYKESYKDSAYNVHIPSTTRPLRLGKFYGGYNISNPGNEYGVMDVYKDYVDIRGIVGSNEYTIVGNTIVKESERHTVNTQEYSDKISQDLGRNNMDSLCYFNGEYVIFSFNDQDAGWVFPSEYGNIVDVREFIVKDGNGDDITEMLRSKSNPKIGFYTDNTSAYTFGSCKMSKSHDGRGYQLSISGSFKTTFPDVQFPVDVYLKAETYSEYSVKDIEYENKYFPLAHYRLKVGGINNKNIESKDFSYFEDKINEHI